MENYAFQKSLAFVNMFAILKDLETLVTLDEDAKKIAQEAGSLSIGFSVKDGPKAALQFSDANISTVEHASGKIKLYFSSCKHFNDMIDGKRNPMIVGGFLHLGFLAKKFTALTDTMTRYLRASADDLRDRSFFEKSTTMMFYLIANALSAIGNYDEVGQVSASRAGNGSLALEIENGPASEIVFDEGKMTTYNRKVEHARAYMIFRSLDEARALFDGTLDSYSAIASGAVVMKGFIPMIDNANRLLSRVAQFLS